MKHNRFQGYTVGCILVLAAMVVCAGQNQKRNRGEVFYHTFNANTPGPGDVWLTLESVGHVWDDSPLSTDTSSTVTPVASGAPERRWLSNIRAFPDVRIVGGITDFLSVHAASRVLSYGFEPGFYSGGVRCTWPDNKNIRVNAYGLMLDYKYIVRDRAPTLGGYIGFMPEGFYVRGTNIEARVLYELDMLPVQSRLPLRLCVNSGLRIPVTERREMFQFVTDIMAIYSGYGFDFYAGYSLESFMNFFSPTAIVQPGGGKTFLMWFEENPMYLNLGGNIRYDNGVTLSLTVPLLLSVNHGSRMRSEDMVELIHKQPNGLFTYEKDRNIRDPFDPWFVKWKIAGAVTVPLHFTMTGAEMMRNYLLLKNRKEQRVIDIDKRTITLEKKTPAEDTLSDDAARLERIRRQRELLSK